MKEYESPAYELLEWFDANWNHKNALHVRHLIPEHLTLWLAYCQQEGLISPGALPNITDIGRLVLLRHGERAASSMAKTSVATLSKKEVADRLEVMRSQGEPWTSYNKMARRIRCSSRTVHQAVKDNKKLTAWAEAKRQSVAPRAQSINEVVTDRTAQQTEMDPADEAAIREYIEQAGSEERAWFLALSSENQIAFLDDPDRHSRILGRRA